MKYAAIDIGTNAVRLLIEEAFETDDNEFYFKKISLTRVPIRLGTDVFMDQMISKQKAKNLYKCMIAFKNLMEINEVSSYRACATSAMREALNGKFIRAEIENDLGIQIEIITGREEAQMILDNFHLSKVDKTKSYLYIDVGGGSTEVSLIKNGERIRSKSFQLGSVRLLQGTVDPKIWEESKLWVESICGEEDAIIAIGTGGNINNIYKESRHQFGESITYDEIKDIVDFIAEHTLEDRIKKLKLKPDRADVIIPAGSIYLHFMKSAFADEMIVPKVGLSDGIIYNLYKKDKESSF